MQRLSQFIVFFVFCILKSQPILAQTNPHGSDFVIDCKQCHNSGSWNVSLAEMSFDHSRETGFPLEGQHGKIDCKKCHDKLDFKGLWVACVSCHLDVHEMSVGDDCKRCHNENNWLVNDLSEVHAENGFVLEGAHSVVSCVDCHKSGNSLVWERMTGNCADCHMKDYETTAAPSHRELGYSTDCIECHSPMSQVWNSEFFHYFFPLTGGHSGVSCIDCHKNQPYQQASSECISCHQKDYDAAANPNHKQLGFPTDCALCHSTQPGWKPARYDDHDQDFFPIYSGNHKGAWSSCTECHTNPNNFSLFSCIDCHEHNDPRDLADEHDDVKGYVYQSQACFECHPKGSE
jgi:hypothetical protein